MALWTGDEGDGAHELMPHSFDGRIDRQTDCFPHSCHPPSLFRFLPPSLSLSRFLPTSLPPLLLPCPLSLPARLIQVQFSLLYWLQGLHGIVDSTPDCYTAGQGSIHTLAIFPLLLFQSLDGSNGFSLQQCT